MGLFRISSFGLAICLMSSHALASRERNETIEEGHEVTSKKVKINGQFDSAEEQLLHEGNRKRAREYGEPALIDELHTRGLKKPKDNSSVINYNSLNEGTALAPLIGIGNKGIGFKILTYLNPDELNSLAKAHPSSYKLIIEFRKAELNAYLSGVNNSNMLEGHIELGPLSSQDKNYIRNLLSNRLKGISLSGEQMEAPGFVFVAKGSCLNGICLRSLQRITNLNGLISDEQLKTICAKLFAPGQNSGVTIETIANYLPFNLYTQEGQVFNADAFVKKIEALENFKPLVHFSANNMDEAYLQNNTCEIIIDDTALQTNLAKLQDILKNNPNHTITLNLEDQFIDEEGEINLSAEDLPNNIGHLRLIDIKGKIVSVGDQFLDGCTSLTSFDSSGLSNVTQIGDDFLDGCTSLTNFDSSGLTNLTEIRYQFLFGCTSLTSFDSSGLTNLTEIADYFLHACTSLTSFDRSGLSNVTQIMTRFLGDCTSLTSFDSSGLSNVTQIGDDFLLGCTSLTSFDSSGLTNLTKIGHTFLAECTSLTRFDSSGLSNVTQIGHGFLDECTSLSQDTKYLFLEKFICIRK